MSEIRRSGTARPIEAVPQTPAMWATRPYQPEVVAAARARRVIRIVHFTTVLGVVGILSAQAVKSRRRLPAEKHLERVYRPNALDRSRDTPWHDYVNLSVSEINDWMFERSERWHADESVSWVVLSFSADILGDPGVVFCTTNNIYPACHRAEGLAGFEQLFDDPVLGRYGVRHSREGLSDNAPTDRQAEVLYPGELALDRLQSIHVQLEPALDDVEGALGGLDLDYPVHLAPEEFQ